MRARTSAKGLPERDGERNGRAGPGIREDGLGRGLLRHQRRGSLDGLCHRGRSFGLLPGHVAVGGREQAAQAVYQAGCRIGITINRSRESTRDPPQK